MSTSFSSVRRCSLCGWGQRLTGSLNNVETVTYFGNDDELASIPGHWTNEPKNYKQRVCIHNMKWEPKAPKEK